MKKIIFLCLLCELLIHSAQAQYVQSPTSYAYKAVEGRNALQGPVGCGEPADSVRSFFAPDSTRAAYYVDTCNNLFYYFNSKLQEWETITGGSQTVYVDSVYKRVDSFFFSKNNVQYFIGLDSVGVATDTSIFYFDNDTTIINKIKIKNLLSIPLTDTTNAIKSCGALIYDTINEHFYGDVCLNGVHAYWGCLDCIGGGGAVYVDSVYKRIDSFFYSKNNEEFFIGTDSIGTSGNSVKLQTNGVDNGSQDTLNLQEGTNINITDNGTGTVTINYESGLITMDTTFTLDGTVLLLTVPHNLGVTPSDVHVQVDTEAGLSTFVPPYFDDTNIYIPYSIGPICTCEYVIRITP